jgi:hypothetical protein
MSSASKTKIVSLTSVPLDLLEQEYKARQTRLSGLLEQRESLSGHLTDVDSQIEALHNPPANAAQKAIAKKYGIPPKSELSPAQKAAVTRGQHQGEIQVNHPPMKERLLSMLKNRKPMRATEMGKKLVEGGYQTISTPSVLVSSISSAMGKDKRFKRTEPGTFTLA